jgi:hypothetical protein
MTFVWSVSSIEAGRTVQDPDGNRFAGRRRELTQPGSE